MLENKPQCAFTLKTKETSLFCSSLYKNLAKRTSQGLSFWWAVSAALEVLASVQFSRSVVSKSLRPHRLHHARPPCPLPTLGVYSNSCPLSRWGHPTVSSSFIPSSSCLQFFPASGSFQMSELFASGGQSIGSFIFSISPSNEYSGLISFRMDWVDLLAVQGTLKSFL